MAPSEVGRLFSFCHLRERCFGLFDEMRRKNELCDVTFSGEDVSISAHKVIMAAAFSRFLKIFSQSVDHTLDIKPNELAWLIKYAYTFEVTIGSENVESMLDAACYLGADEEKKMCSAILNETKKQASMFFAFNEMRQKKELCDVIFNIGGMYIYAHRIILAAAIPYFRDKFSRGVCEVTGIEPNALVCLIIYAYTYRIRINACNVNSLFSAACRLGLDEVKQACSDFLPVGLEPEIACVMESKFVQIYLPKMESNCNILLLVSLPKIRKTHYSFKIQPRKDNESACLEDIEMLCICELADGEVHTVQDSMSLRDRCVTEIPETFEKFSGSAVPLQGKMYFFQCCTTWRYDPKYSSLVSMCSMPTCRDFVGATALKNKIYICGGRLCDNTATNAVECFDPAANAWTTVKSMSTSCGGLSAVTLDENIFVIGGANDTCLNTVEKYDPIHDKWTSMSPMHFTRSVASVAALKGKIYVYGGMSCTGYFTTGEIYDPIGNAWHLISPPKLARKCFTLLSFERGPHTIGGSNDENEQVHNSGVCDPQEDEWECCISTDHELCVSYNFVMASVDELT